MSSAAAFAGVVDAAGTGRAAAVLAIGLTGATTTGFEAGTLPADDFTALFVTLDFAVLNVFAGFAAFEGLSFRPPLGVTILPVFARGFPATTFKRDFVFEADLVADLLAIFALERAFETVLTTAFARGLAARAVLDTDFGWIFLAAGFGGPFFAEAFTFTGECFGRTAIFFAADFDATAAAFLTWTFAIRQPLPIALKNEWRNIAAACGFRQRPAYNNPIEKITITREESPAPHEPPGLWKRSGRRLAPRQSPKRQPKLLIPLIG